MREERLLKFTREPADDAVPIVFACVVAQYQGRVVFVFNSKWREWELPAGMIEPGETPEAAAKRELYEESGQVAESLQFEGVASIYVLKPDVIELGVMYTCELETLQPFQPNDEADRMMLWDLNQPVDEAVSAVGHQLALMLTESES